jgi:2,4-dienoyl-CoA reductase-like NADH-dependent reductase (Old Yellow Enzyme family)
MDFHQRTWVPAMVPWRASDDGYVTDAVIEWYARFAAGRPGAIVVEATGIRDIPSGPLLRIGHDRFIPGLKRLTAAVAAASEGRTRLLIQLIDFLNIRRRVSRAVYVERFLKINAHHKARTGRTAADDTGVKEALLALPEQDFAAILTARERDDYLMGYRERVTDTHIPQIAALPQILPGLFADAAARAQAAGFDGVELHYAHAYTMASFLSARNTREDGYGGTLANRMRLPLEVYNAVRQRLGGAFPVGCRYLAEECIEGGTPLSDACAMGVAFARAGLDYLSLSRGGKFEDASQPKIGAAAYPYTGPSGYECMPSFMSDSKGPFGRNVGPAGNIRKAIRDAGFNTPVVVAGGFHNFTAAEATLVAGHADIIGMARQSLADPDWPLKVQSGKGHEVRICEYSNYCEALDQKHVEVTCQLWDREDLGNDVRRSQDGKRRLTAPHWIRGA